MPSPLIAIRAPEAIFQGEAGRAVATKQGQDETPSLLAVIPAQAGIQ